MSYFKALLDLLIIERNEDRVQYKKLTQQNSINQRRESGIVWYPVAIRGTELTKGDYINLEVERTTHQHEPHQLRFGMPAVLYSQHDAQNDRVEGMIAFIKGNVLKINLRIDELPEWTRNGKLAVELLFDENSYEEIEFALKRFEKIETDKEATLLQILLGNKKPTFNETVFKFENKNLNVFQNNAVQKIVQANELAIVHGPPGTGKTTTLVHAIKALLKHNNKKILVVAPSNTAVDVLSEKLHEQGVSVLRMGNPIRVSEQLQSLTMDSKMQLHADSKQIKAMRKQANEFRDMAHKYKRNFGRDERDQRKLLFEEAKNIIKNIDNIEKYITDDIIAKAQVISATLIGSKHYLLKNVQFHTVVIDEAGQALEPSCWVAIEKAQKLILAGDHCQLPPTIKSHEAAKGGLEKTLFEKKIALHPEAVTLLQEQYRMHEHIMQYSSQHFYDGKLIANENVKQRKLFARDASVNFIDTAGCGFDEKINGHQISNPEEAQLLFKHLVQYLEQLQNENVLQQHAPSIAIISPYKMQVIWMQEYILSYEAIKPFLHLININTIDSFQGQEKDIVYISMVRSNDTNQIGFLADLRRMNVAMTRAKQKLVIVGDSATLSTNKFYENLIIYTQSIDAWVSAWEYNY
jgi:ATP-dependent RNA/DNA helicase IGHMBP2